MLLPSATMCMLFPHSFHCLALNIQQTYSKQLPPQPPLLFKLQLPASVAAFIEELSVLLRGLYLALLFTPMVLTAPFVFYLSGGGVAGRAAWMDLLRNTMAAAGA